MYKQATAAMIAKYGYDPPEAAPVEGKDYSVCDINTYEGEDRIKEETARKEYRQKLHKQITNWAQYHFRRKKVNMDGITEVFLEVLDANFDKHWNTLLALNACDLDDRIKELNCYCEARWNEESEDFKEQLREELEHKHELDLADHRDRGSWTGDAESYARMWRRAQHILPPLVVSIAKLFGVGASFFLWGPRADGAISVDSISCQVPGANTRKDLSEFHPVAYAAMHKLCQDYANAVFPPSLCQSRIVEGGVGDMEPAQDLDSHAGQLFCSAPNGQPAVIGANFDTATPSHSSSTTVTNSNSPTNLDSPPPPVSFPASTSGGSVNPSMQGTSSSATKPPLPAESNLPRPGNVASLDPPPQPISFPANASGGSASLPMQGTSSSAAFYNNSGLTLSNTGDDVWQSWSKTLPPNQLADIDMMNQHMNPDLYHIMNGPGNMGDLSVSGNFTSPGTNNGFTAGGTNTMGPVWTNQNGLPGPTVLPSGQHASETSIGTATADGSAVNLQIGFHDQFHASFIGDTAGIKVLGSSKTDAPADPAAEYNPTPVEQVLPGGGDPVGELSLPSSTDGGNSSTNDTENSPTPKRKAPEQSASAPHTSKRRKTANHSDGPPVEVPKEVDDGAIANRRGRRTMRVPTHLLGGGKGSYIVTPDSPDASMEDTNDEPVGGKGRKKGGTQRKLAVKKSK
ncbi:hypothetical protein PM082_023629 [Marasmius tenuissimus]|nr:hypothetical protein PM082_023629 [Marasmius tenuissimus]